MERWDLEGELSGVDVDERTGETVVRIADGRSAVVRGTRAVRCPRPLPTPARIVSSTRVVTGEIAVLTLALAGGETVQIAGSGLVLRAA